MNFKKSFLLCFISLTIIAVTPLGSRAGLKWTLEIPMTVGKEAWALMDGRRFPLGKVLALPGKSRYPAYTASAWGIPGFTCASAVNAHHILLSVEKGKGRTVSLVPSDTVAPAATPGTAAVIDGKGGTGLFGAFAPPAGSPVFIRKQNGETLPPGPNHMPKPGDTLVIPVTLPDSLLMADLENRPGGRIVLYSSSGPSLIGRVVRPLAGTGRFEGTLYQSSGRLRANHPGVIDISTSPYGKIGGFQIVPLKHGNSPEMASMWNMTQWMIITSAHGPDLAGRAPLFFGNLMPGPVRIDDERAMAGLSLWKRYGMRSLVMCRMDGGPWRKLPRVQGKNDQGLRRVTHLRIYFPWDREPLSD